MSLSPRAKVIIRHIMTSIPHEFSVDDIVHFSPVDGDIGGQKTESRENAEAICELIKADLATLWVIDKWLEVDVEALQRGEEVEVDSTPPVPRLVVVPTEHGVEEFEKEHPPRETMPLGSRSPGAGRVAGVLHAPWRHSSQRLG